MADKHFLHCPNNHTMSCDLCHEITKECVFRIGRNYYHPSCKQWRPLIHRRFGFTGNETLCGGDGRKITITAQVTCPECLEIIAKREV